MIDFVQLFFFLNDINRIDKVGTEISLICLFILIVCTVLFALKR